MAKVSGLVMGKINVTPLLEQVFDASLERKKTGQTAETVVVVD